MAEGDKETFLYLFEKYNLNLCNCIDFYLNTKKISKKIVQDIFVYSREKIGYINIESSVRSYL